MTFLYGTLFYTNILGDSKKTSSHLSSTEFCIDDRNCWCMSLGNSDCLWYSAWGHKETAIHFVLMRADVKNGSVNSEAATEGVLRCSYQFRNFYRNATVAGQSTTLLKQTLAQLLFYEFCEISKNTFFIEHLWWLLFVFVKLQAHKLALLIDFNIKPMTCQTLPRLSNF